MERNLINAITKQTEILFANVETTIATCDLDYVLCDMPIHKHVYHTLHSLDRWFINPNDYIEPSFHEPGLNSLDIESSKTLSREELNFYFDTIKSKIYSYLGSLTDDMLYTKPVNCPYTVLELILGQYRHLDCHLGNINCTTIINTGKWPRVVGLDGDLTKGLYE